MRHKNCLRELTSLIGETDGYKRVDAGASDSTWDKRLMKIQLVRLFYGQEIKMI